ncbi:hypothetical protein TorRG33x02_191560 [Trema orientale]|uniref:Uncharacterized protein n=1 Tax=Trema orientale TaxID=63057 RepID=A0A2P5EHN3_TREOI|nr:hypothetical protein TorRG33x02_191560 [Trema orientale]
MDHHDLKASGTENKVGNPCSPKKPILVGKGNSLGECHEELADASVGPRKKGYEDHEINSCKAEKLQGIERSDRISSSDYTKETVSDLRPSFIISTQRSSVLEKQIFADGSPMVMPHCNEVKVTEIVKNSDASSKVNTPLKKISMNSDISSDSGQPLDNDFQTGMNRYCVNTGENGLKSGIQALFSDKQCKTESSSSNSSHVILPASSNDSCQETSLDIQSCKVMKKNGMDTSTCTDFKIILKDPASGNLLPGLAIRNPEDKLEGTISPGKGCNLAKVAEILDGVRTRSGDYVARMSSDDNNYVTMENIHSSNSDSFKKETDKVASHGKAKLLYKLEDAVDMAPRSRVTREVDQELEVSGSSSSAGGRNSEVIRQRFVDSVDSNGKSCLTETGSVIQQCKGQDESFSFCSMKEVLDTRTLARNESLCSEGKGVKEPFADIGRKVTHDVIDGLHGQELSYRTIKDASLTSLDRTGHLSRIDLNEDVLEHAVEYIQQFAKDTVPNHMGSVSKPKAVVAKSGIPLYTPTPPKVQKEWELSGWRGSAASSAFRPTSITKNCIENNKAMSTNDKNGIEGHVFANRIDLNVAATGVDFDVESLKDKPAVAESSFPSKMEVGSHARKLDIDLNCVSENDDDCHQSSHITSLSRNSVRDFDLNDNPTSMDSPNFSINPTSMSRHSGQGNKALGSRGSDSPPVSSVENPKQQDLRSLRSTYPTDLGSMPGFFTSHVQPILVAAPHMLPSNEQLPRIAFLQPQLAYAQAPPHVFRVDPKDGLSLTAGTHNVLPYRVDPHSTNIISQVLGSGGLSAFPCAPHVFQVPHGSGSGNIAMTRPNTDAYNGMNNSLENVNRGTNGGQLCIPSSNSTTEEQTKSFQQVGLSAAGVKRREPDGGWDPQLSFRQMTSWR